MLPWPRQVTSESGDPVPVSAHEPVTVSDPALEPIASWFAHAASQVIRPSTPAQPGAPIAFAIGAPKHQQPPAHGVRPGATAADERYELTVEPSGVVVLGATPEGVFRGATTLLHLFLTQSSPGHLERQAITDGPAYAWRGLSLDVVRCFHPPATVRRVIDLMALYKLNVLHLHLTDTEGWRFPVAGIPALTEVGGRGARDDRPGGWYRADEYADLVDYAAHRFITVVPEFDSPGHVASMLTALPDLADEAVHAMPTAMQYLDPARDQVWPVIGEVLDAMAAATPGAFLHIGGDEAVAMTHEQFGAFMAQAMPLARDTGKKLVAWQEAARAGFQPGDLMQWWIPDTLVAKSKALREDPERAAEYAIPPEVAAAFADLFAHAPQDLPAALAQGAEIVISRADLCYLDASYVEPPAPGAPESQVAWAARLGLPNEIYGNHTVAGAFDWAPESVDPHLPADRIAGVEAAIWCETITGADDLFFLLLPRLPGIAEKGWSQPTTWAHYRPRLQAQDAVWDALDLPYYRSSTVW